MLWCFMSSECLVIYEKDTLNIGTRRNNCLHISPFEKIINLRRQTIA